MALKYKIGDRVRIKSLDWYNENKDKFGNIRYKRDGSAYPVFFSKYMSNFCGEILTIKSVFNHSYHMNETSSCEFWTDEMIEGLVEDETKPKFKVGDEVIAYAEGCLAKFSINDVRWNNELNKFEYKICSSWYDASVMQLYKESNNFLTERVSDNGLPFNEWLSYKGAFYVPDGYELKDENGNIINATKIVLEKKKKEYPKTYEECAEVLDVCSGETLQYGDLTLSNDYEFNLYTLLENFRKLLICRDAYWKIAGDEMGLGKPWEPDWNDTSIKYCLERDFDAIDKNVSNHKGRTFAFPTEEMRDAFKENFDPDIEFCKELL